MPKQQNIPSHRIRQVVHTELKYSKSCILN